MKTHSYPSAHLHRVVQVINRFSIRQRLSELQRHLITSVSPTISSVRTRWQGQGAVLMLSGNTVELSDGVNVTFEKQQTTLNAPHTDAVYQINGQPVVDFPARLFDGDAIEWENHQYRFQVIPTGTRKLCRFLYTDRQVTEQMQSTDVFQSQQFAQNLKFSGQVEKLDGLQTEEKSN